MKVLEVVGPDGAGRTELLQGLAAALSERERVATVRSETTAPSGRDHGGETATPAVEGADKTLGRRPDGWVAVGDDRSLEDVVERLAPEYGYALLEGFSNTDFPTVAVGNADSTEPVVATVEHGADADVDEIVAEIEELEEFETLSSLVAEVKRADGSDHAGAIATFTGRVRQHDGPDDPATEHLEFEKYDSVAEDRMAEIRADLTARDDVHEVLLHHRTGVVEAGEDIVFVVVLAGHRESAFRTVQDGINRLKAEVPLFKREVTVEGEFWRHQHDH